MSLEKLRGFGAVWASLYALGQLLALIWERLPDRRRAALLRWTAERTTRAGFWFCARGNDLARWANQYDSAHPSAVDRNVG